MNLASFEPPRHRRRRLIANVVSVLACGPAGLGLVGFANQAAWPFELACHFRFQYAVCLVAAAVVLAGCRVFWRAAGCVAAAVPNLLVLAPLWLDGPSPTPGSEAVAALKAIVFNLQKDNRSEGVLAFLDAEDADLVVLLEATPAWLERLAPLRTRYPYVVERPRNDFLGIALLSKLALVRSEVVALGSVAAPSIEAEIELRDGRRLTVFGTHPVPPTSREFTEHRDDQLTAVATHLETVSRPLVLLGDLNITRWSQPFAALLERARLEDSALGFGYQPTWPMQLPLLGIPIDHCLHSSDVRILDRRTGPALGSDHRPLVVELGL